MSNIPIKDTDNNPLTENFPLFKMTKRTESIIIIISCIRGKEIKNTLPNPNKTKNNIIVFKTVNLRYIGISN
jgi:hypothetical protein